MRRARIGVLLALVAATAATAQTELALAVGGLVNAPRSFTVAELQEWAVSAPLTSQGLIWY